jgi:thiamine biosynthesis lipoprotein
MRHIFETMGTVATLSLEAPAVPHLVAEVEEVFAGYDRTFSLYRPDSALSQIADGRMRLEDAPEMVRSEYERAIAWRSRTNGWFDPHRPDGVIDLSGTIKAAAMDAASWVLIPAGADGILGVGGDLLTVGTTDQRVGIADPQTRDRVIADLSVQRRRAVATSGSAERGDHIWSRFGPSDIVQATVLGDDIVSADVLATAIVAAGTASMNELLDAFDIDALVVTADGLYATPGWPTHPTL